MATLSSAVKPPKTEVVWNERASPRRARSCTGLRVMSRPAKWMAPWSGVVSPESWRMAVVLPAPLGPMTAWTSPWSTSRESASVALRKL